MCSAHLLLRVVGALVAAMMVLSATPAEAASNSTLCKGFRDCGNEERSHAGYAKVYKRSFWNMRAGHNCTNYVAYRMTHGRLVSRPPGANDAGTWGRAARAAGHKVDRTPKVGAVAWWSARRGGGGKVGHVAYVEAVRSDGSIIISEDHLGGTFMWRRLTKKSKSWPTRFIHFRESDGSPAGKVLWAKSAGAGILNFSATSNEPDVGAGNRSYLVTVGAPRGTEGAETFQFSTPHFRFIRLKTVSTRGTVPIYVYALNTPNTGGTDTLLGSATVTIS